MVVQGDPVEGSGQGGVGGDEGSCREKREEVREDFCVVGKGVRLARGALRGGGRIAKRVLLGDTA